MEERFIQQVIFSPKIDFLDCPVEITKGAILFDALKNTCVLQLKLNNTTIESISSVMLEVICFNDEEVPLNANNPIKYTYSVPSNAKFFGSDYLIDTNLNNVCSVQIIIKKVVVNTGYIWEYTEHCSVERKSQVPLPKIFKKLLECNQYVQDNSRIQFIPIDNGRYWTCACGKQNSTSQCIKCGLTKDIIFSMVNTTTLKSQLDEYLNELEEKSILKYEYLNRQIKKKSKFFRMLSLILSFCIIVISMSWIFNSSVKAIKFNQAKALIVKQEYDAAIEKFNSLPLVSHGTRMDNSIELEIKNILEKFRHNTITKATAEIQFKQLKKYKNISYINIYDKETDEFINATDYFSDEIRLLEKSRLNFEQANNYKASGEYLNALSCYSKIIIDDLNYAKAQYEIRDLKNLLKKESIVKLENYRISKNYIEALDLLTNINEYLGEDKDIQNYQKYFNAVEQGERYLTHYWFYRRPDLYYEPSKDSPTGSYYRGSGEATVYEYYIDNNFNLWVKTRSSDGEYFWSITNE